MRTLAMSSRRGALGSGAPCAVDWLPAAVGGLAMGGVAVVSASELAGSSSEVASAAKGLEWAVLCNQGDGCMNTHVRPLTLSGRSIPSGDVMSPP